MPPASPGAAGTGTARSGPPAGTATARTAAVRILGAMSKRAVVAGVVWVVLTVLAFLADPILGACVLIFGGIGVVVVALGGSYDQHPDFEARELARARRRAARRERHQEKNKDAIAADRARYAAHQAKLAAKREAAGQQADGGPGPAR